MSRRYLEELEFTPFLRKITVKFHFWVQHIRKFQTKNIPKPLVAPSMELSHTLVNLVLNFDIEIFLKRIEILKPKIKKR